MKYKHGTFLAAMLITSPAVLADEIAIGFDNADPLLESEQTCEGLVDCTLETLAELLTTEANDGVEQ